ncbi:MAG: DegV family protein [Dictyoglomus turgidum]|jgi:DegV family protein with EDD domain|uniref:DegV family protein n=1 Tax=Dictyoglomus TaxID=13 RepID=UPI003C795FC7
MIKIVTDSTAALPKEYVEKYDVTVVPLKVAFGDEVYRDGVDITPEIFFKKVKESTVFPKTSQPSVEEFYQAYQNIFEKHPDTEAIISIHISAKLSGTVGSANAAREIHPQKDKIFVVDSKLTELALGVVVIELAKAIEKGAKVDDLINLAEKLYLNSNIKFTVDTLEYLYRGGRIGAAQAWMGSILQIKPILELREGAIEPVERVRTKQKLRARIIELIKEYAGKDPVKIAVAYSDNYEEVLEISQEVKNTLNITDFYMGFFSCTILSHLGPGSWGIIAFKEV